MRPLRSGHDSVQRLLHDGESRKLRRLWKRLPRSVDMRSRAVHSVSGQSDRVLHRAGLLAGLVHVDADRSAQLRRLLELLSLRMRQWPMCPRPMRHLVWPARRPIAHAVGLLIWKRPCRSVKSRCRLDRSC